jgi:hypothetical protein
VSKILKSVAVDCILNKEQQAFSKMTEVVKIQLSDKNEIDYEVKDQPFTSLCDYSETCDFECVNKPSAFTDKTTYTYESAKNSKVADRIKELFTLRHIYHEEELINLLKTKGKGIEIERVIYDMINDKELLIDKFGRKGSLVNINNLYIFQPIEIKNKHATMYERMNPITYKPKMVQIYVDGDTEEDEDEEEEDEHDEHEEKPKSKSKITRKGKSKTNFMEKLMTSYDKAKVGSNDDDWYDHYYSTLKLLKIYLNDMDKDLLLIFHICETFTFEEDLQAIELFVKDDVSEIEDVVKKYYEQFVVQKDDITGILLMNYALKDPLQVYVLNEHSGSGSNGNWIPATYEEKGILSKEIKKKIKMREEEELFKWVGYMGMYKGSFNFKLINTETSTDREKLTSSVFELKGRPEMYKILNETVDESFTYNKSTADVKKIQLAILQEIYLRIYNRQNEERYFLNKLETYILNKKLR